MLERFDGFIADGYQDGIFDERSLVYSGAIYGKSMSNCYKSKGTLRKSLK